MSSLAMILELEARVWHCWGSVILSRVPCHDLILWFCLSLANIKFPQESSKADARLPYHGNLARCMHARLVAAPIVPRAVRQVPRNWSRRCNTIYHMCHFAVGDVGHVRRSSGVAILVHCIQSRNDASRRRMDGRTTPQRMAWVTRPGRLPETEGSQWQRSGAQSSLFAPTAPRAQSQSSLFGELKPTIPAAVWPWPVTDTRTHGRALDWRRTGWRPTASGTTNRHNATAVSLLQTFGLSLLHVLVHTSVKEANGSFELFSACLGLV